MGAFRNIPGTTLISADRLNVLKLAPGGHVGRFLIWTQSALERLDSLYGTWTKKATEKSNYNLPMPKMTCTDISRIMHLTKSRQLFALQRRVARGLLARKILLRTTEL